MLGDRQRDPPANPSAEHFQRTSRPLRTAIDEVDWRFRNLTASQVACIQQQEPRAHAIEKAIFYRLCPLLKLNVQLIFVFDAPRWPRKRGKAPGQVNSKLSILLRHLPDLFAIPHHEAPAEAAAECARLQKAGVVDAVWSDDGDTLMFGCGLRLRGLYQDKGRKRGKSDTHVRLCRANTIWEQYLLESKWSGPICPSQ